MTQTARSAGGTVGALIDRRRTGYHGGMDEIVSRCPVCGARVHVNAGDPTPAHQNEDSGVECPGTGQPSD